MSTSEAPVQCSDPVCTRPLDNVDSQCQRCMRPIHDGCGGAVDEEIPDSGRFCPGCMEPDVNKGPQKRRRLDLSEKVRALDMLESGATPQEVASEFGSSKRAIMRMKKESHIIRGLSESGARGSMKSRKQSHPGKYAALETKVMQILQASRGNRITITNDLIRSCSSKVQEDMLKDTSLGPDDAKDLQMFNPTDIWIKGFARRHNLQIPASRTWPSTNVLNESRRFPEVQNLKNELERYDPECILSVHETTLFHKILPRKAYLASITDDAGVNSLVFPPDMETKDRLTLVVCTNATGTLKVPLTIVGRSKQPQSFRVKRCPLPYLGQNHAWFDVCTFREWFSEVLLPAVRKHSWKNVAVLVENTDEEKIAEDSRGQVKLFRLPPDSRSKRYPMEHGIMEAVKHKYRYTMLERVVELIPVRDAIQACSEKKDVKLRGLDDGYDPNELDAAEILYDIWQGTSTQSIARSWVKSKILPDAYNATMIARHGNSQAFGRADVLLETCTVKEREIVDRMNTLIRSRSLRAREGSSEALVAIVNVLNSMNEGDLETWLSLEEKPEIRSALLRETQDLLLASATQNNILPGRANGQLGDQEQHAVTQLQSLPNLAAIAHLFVPLEELVSVCDSGDAALHIRQAKRILFKAKIHEEAKAVSHPPNVATLPTDFSPR